MRPFRRSHNSVQASLAAFALVFFLLTTLLVPFIHNHPFLAKEGFPSQVAAAHRFIVDAAKHPSAPLADCFACAWDCSLSASPAPFVVDEPPGSRTTPPQEQERPASPPYLLNRSSRAPPFA